MVIFFGSSHRFRPDLLDTDRASALLVAAVLKWYNILS